MGRALKLVATYCPSLLVIGAIALTGQVRVVLGDSMLPTLAPGDAVYVTSDIEPQPGDVITFSHDSRCVSHRVIRTEEGTLHTKGDNNSQEDPWTVDQADVIGVVRYRVPYLGYLLMFVRQPLGWAVCVGIPAIVLIADEIRKMREKLRKPVPTDTSTTGAPSE